MEDLEQHLIEAREQYAEARSKAKLNYAKAVSQGKDGHLPALEGALEHTQIAAEQYVGLEEVPLHRIVGTVTHSRARSFASGFLPLTKQKSEFGTKWVNVYIHQIKTGISDPVILQEYLNWYWVFEGNKRVSVFNYLGAYSIEAKVTRLLPRKDSDNPVVPVYYRFLDFKGKTGLKNIWIRSENGYDKLLSYLHAAYGKSEKSHEKYQEFYRDIYLPFRTIYKRSGGDKLKLTTGEAFLTYVKVAGFPKSFSGDQNRQRVEEVVKEMSLSSEEVGVTSEPLRHPRPGIMDTIGQIFRPAKPFVVAFVHYGSSSISVWNQHHERARKYLEEHMRGRVETKAYWTDGDIDSFRRVIQKAAHRSDVVFSTAAILYDETRKIAIEHPEVKFFVASRQKSGLHILTYSPRTHEVHFLSGMIAGALSKERPIAFVISNYSAYAFASINAFALGARGVNRNARIKLSWNSHWDDNPFTMDILPEGIEEGDNLFFHNIIPPRESTYQEYGLYAWRKSGLIQYAELTYDWREFYQSVIENILAGNLRAFESAPGKQARFLTYWGGLKNGIVDLNINREGVGPDISRMIDGMKTLLLLGEFSPFTGPLRDRTGQIQLKDGESLNYDEITAMNYLVEGVIGPYIDPAEVVTS